VLRSGQDDDVDTIGAPQPLSIPPFDLPDKREVLIILRRMLGNGETLCVMPAAFRPLVIPCSTSVARKELLRLNISARITSAGGAHSASVETSGVVRSLRIPAKAQGAGSSVNGGELLFLALATCFCNDVYREAAKRDLVIDRLEVDVNGAFDADGVARNIRYRTEIASNAPRDPLADLVRYVDEIAEIHRAVRRGTPVELVEVSIHSEAVR
jgi:uncharacterized OsmC-like protein